MNREWLIQIREERQLLRAAVAKAAGCTERLIEHIEEDGWITHPHIAARIAAALKLSVSQYNQLVHRKHRADVLPEPVPIPNERDWKDYIAKCKKAEA